MIVPLEKVANKKNNPRISPRVKDPLGKKSWYDKGKVVSPMPPNITLYGFPDITFDDMPTFIDVGFGNKLTPNDQVSAPPHGNTKAPC